MKQLPGIHSLASQFALVPVLPQSTWSYLPHSAPLSMSPLPEMSLALLHLEKFCHLSRSRASSTLAMKHSWIMTPPLEHSGTKTRMSQSLLYALLTFHRHLYKIFSCCIVNTCGGSVILTALWAVVSSFVLHTHVLTPPPGTWYVTWETIIFC